MIRSICFNYLGMIVTGLVGFLLTPLLIHGLGDYHYGMWILVSSIVDYYGLADLGIRFTLQRHVARFRGTDQREALDRTFVTALVMSLYVSGLILLMTLGSAHWLPSVFHVSGADRSQFIRVLLLLGISFVVALPGKVLGAYICGLQRFDLHNLVGTGTTILQALLLIWTLHVGRGIEGCAAVTLFVGSFSLVLYWMLVKIADPQANLNLRQTSWSEMCELFNFGVYVFVSQVGDLFRFRLDSLVIARWLNLSLVTHFNVAARLVEYFRYVSAAIVGPLITEMSTLDGQDKEEHLQGLFLRSTRFTALLSLLVGALICVNGRALFSVWLGNGFVSSYAVLITLAIARTGATLQSPSMVLLLARGRHRALGWWTLGEGVVNLVLSIHWATKFGMLGVAMGTAVPMFFFRLVVQPWYTLRIARVSPSRYFAESLMRPLLVLAFFLFIVHLGSPFPTSQTAVSLVGQVLWQAFVYGALAYFAGFTSIERQGIRERVKALLARREAIPAA